MHLPPRDSEGTVGKAVAVLDQVAEFGRPVRFAELLESSPFPKATLYRLVQGLVRQRMLDHDAVTGRYVPGLRLVRLAHSAWRSSSLGPIARPHLDALSHAVGQTVHLARMDGGMVLYIDKRNARDPVDMFSDAGKIGPAYCTGVGKAMLAWSRADVVDDVLARQSWHPFTDTTITDPAAMLVDLAAAQTRGYAIDRQEHERGIVCVALPLLTAAGDVVGAVSITGHENHTTLETLEGDLPKLRATVDNIIRDLRDWRFPDPREGAR